jgi:hypothetical protein
MATDTTPDVFIIESLGFEDERSGRLEGNFLSHILTLADRQVRYVYIRTRAEFEEVLDQFEDSGFRYLHISSHGSAKGIRLTLDPLSIADLQNSLGPCLENRRVFFSACGVVTPDLAKALLKDTGCYSVVGPSQDIEFGEAAVFWAALYHILFRNEAKSVSREALRCAVARAQQALDVHVSYFSRSQKRLAGYVRVK